MTALGDARFVGGCVRDALLGLAAADIDIATPLPPDAVTKRLAAIGVRVIPTGIDHGTVTALTEDGDRFEITTLRRDVACFGRHAAVAFTDDWLADAARRDFTFNALSRDGDGTLYDPFGGAADLAAHRVRFIGSADARIREDVLRLLRFFRFYARFGRAPADAEALAACRNLAPLLPGLSGERVRGELFRILGHPRCAEVWALLADHGILPHLLPVPAGRWPRLLRLLELEAAFGAGAGQDADDSDGANRELVRLAAVLDTDAAGARAVAERLRLSRAERDQLGALVQPALEIPADLPPAASRRVLVRLGDAARFRDLVLLSAATTEPPPAPATVAAALALAARWTASPFPLTGHDVLALGVPAGAAVGRLLAELGQWWADQAFAPDRAACLAELAHRVR
jgi:poly(A) polymerase